MWASDQRGRSEAKVARGGLKVVYVTIPKTQILTALNKQDDFIPAIVEVVGDIAHEPRYIRQPFQREPDLGVTSVNYDLAKLLDRSERPT